MKALIFVLIAMLLSTMLIAGYVPVSVSYSDGTQRVIPDSCIAYVYWHGAGLLDSTILSAGDTVAGAGLPFTLVDSVLVPDDSSGWFTVRYTIVVSGDTVLASETYSPPEGLWGSTHDATLRSLTVSNPSGTAVSFSSSGGSGIGFRINGNQANASFLVQNTGSGSAAKFELTSANTGSGSAFYLKNGQNATETGYAFRVQSSANNYTWLLSNTSTVGGSKTEAWRVESHDSTSNTITWVNAGAYNPAISTNRTFQIEGETYWHGRDDRDEIGFLVVGSNKAVGFKIQSVASHAMRLSGATDSLAGAGLFVDNLWIQDTAKINNGTNDFGVTDTSMVLAVASNHPSVFYGPSGSMGSGSATCTIVAVDTSGADVNVTGVKISVNTLGGALYATGYTSSSGTFSFLATPTDTFSVTGQAIGYMFLGIDGAPADSLSQVIVAGTQSNSLYGYDYPLGSSGVDSTCTVRIYVTGPDGSARRGALVYAQILGGDNLTDGAGHAIKKRALKKRTNSAGYVDFVCLYSSYIYEGADNNIEWRFHVDNGPSQDVLVPSQATYTVDFTND